jgi:hypothetical protein
MTDFGLYKPQSEEQQTPHVLLKHYKLQQAPARRKKMSLRILILAVLAASAMATTFNKCKQYFNTQ